jgi:septal ring factor EnvC (AmiA/AmiB activator)
MATKVQLHHWLLASALLLTLAPASSIAAQSTEKTAAELANLQQEIQQSDEKRRQQQQLLKKADESLKQADTALAAAATAVRNQQQQLAKLQQQLTALDQQQQELEQQRQLQQQLLATQVKAAYQVGGHDYTQLLLNQEDASKLERTLTYYQYFNNARMKQLESLKQTAAALEQVKLEVATTTEQQQQQLTALTQQQQQLADARTEQQQSVKKIQSLLADQQQQLAYLKSNQQSLQATLNKLKAEAAKRKSLAAAAKPGQLPWPVQGAVSQNFGSRQGGETSASGLFIQAKAGETVKAIASGQVIYADWLKGYGWVTVLDHGNGLMSLYGHNQTLLKALGDSVQAGDAVALVGQSGGQNQPGLYFEIRQKGSAVDPRRWLRAR